MSDRDWQELAAYADAPRGVVHLDYHPARILQLLGYVRPWHPGWQVTREGLLALHHNLREGTAEGGGSGHNPQAAGTPLPPQT